MPLLSAALIVRDEERYLGACLRSLRDVVDEIVVVDTGSVDRTREIAERGGARLLETSWRDDFSAARNHALESATGDWILYIDADERVRAAGAVRRALEDPGAVAGLVRFRVQSGFTAYWEYRLFRNHRGIRFRGAIHETIVPDIQARVDAGEGRVIETDLEIDHLGYDGDRTRKHRRDLPLLERAVRADPGRAYLWHALGVARMGLGQPDLAEEAWLRGLEAVRAHPGPQPLGILLYADLAGERLQRGESARALVAEASALYADHPLATWLSARQAVLERRYLDAVRLLERLAAIDPDRRVDRGIALDRRIFRESAYDLLGSCWLQLGEPARAARWLELAEAESDGTNAAVRIKRQLARARAQAAAPGPAAGTAPRAL